MNKSASNISLKDKVIVITGASGVIGKATALACAQADATVVLLGRREKPLTTLYDQIVALGAPEPAMLAMDFSDASPEDFFGLAQSLGHEFTQINGLVHCAANFTHLTPLALTAPDKWQNSYKVNLEAPFLLTQALLPLLDKASKASVVFMHHEEVAHGKRAYWGPYAVSKAGLLSLMHLFSEEHEVQNKIHFNSVDPIRVNSPMRFAASPSGLKNTANPKDVAELIIQTLINEHSETGKVFKIHQTLLS